MTVEYPENYKYTKEHEWIEVNGNVAKIGITAFAQEQLGELVFIELPQMGKVVKQGDPFCVVESTKAASDVYAPVSGKVLAINEALSGDPSLIDKSPHIEGWICEIELSSPEEVTQLMSAAQYKELIS